MVDPINAEKSSREPSSPRPSLTWFDTDLDDYLHAFVMPLPMNAESVEALCGAYPFVDELQRAWTKSREICPVCQEVADPRIATRRIRAEIYASLATFKPLAGEPNPFTLRERDRQRLRRLPMTGFRSERDLRNRVLERLSPWFEISQEVHGAFCDGKRRLRIDAVVRPKRVSNPHNGDQVGLHKDVALGIEFKNPGQGQPGLRHHTAWAAQAIDYTHVEWDGVGRLMVFTCPGVLDNVNEHLEGLDAFEHLLGQLGVGQIILLNRYGLTFTLGGHKVWTESDGFLAKTWSLNLKAGNR